MPKSRTTLVLYAGLLALAAVLAVVVVQRTQDSRQTSSKVYCGPDGRLTSTAPVQSRRSYCLRAFTPLDRVQPGAPIDLSFDIIDDQGETLTAFSTVHERIMHVLVVRHDLTEFQHLHPTFSANRGRFTVNQLVVAREGPYRLFADFTPAGAATAPGGDPLPVTISIDLEAGNQNAYRPQELPLPSRSTRAGDYEVAFARPDTILVGEETRLTFGIQRSGAAVGDLEPYLGANGHAVILREGDLEFTHSHAVDDRAALRNGTLPFIVRFGEPGRYRAFVQFQHRGVVHTAPFTLPPVLGEGAGAGNGAHSGH